MSDFDHDLDLDDLDLDDIEVPKGVPELNMAQDLPVQDIDVNNVDPSQIQPHFGGTNDTDDMVSTTSPTTTESSGNLTIDRDGNGYTGTDNFVHGHVEFKPKDSTS